MLRTSMGVRLGFAATLLAGAAVARGEEWTCSPWEWVQPSPVPLRLSAVVPRGDELWGFGPTGVAVSADGERWQRKSVRTGTMTAALWTGREFLGVAGNVIAASPDGITWETRHEVWQDPIFFTIDLRAIAWNGQRFVAVGQDYSGRYSMWSPVLLTSPDGRVWSRPPYPAAEDPSHASLSAVTWAGDRFVAVGSYLLWSPDGETWTADETVTGTSVAWDGEQVVVAGGDALFLSRDVATWETVPAPAAEARVQALAGRFWLAGRCAACPDHEPSLWSSRDGRSWQREDLESPILLRGMAALGERLVAVGDGVAVRGDGGRWRTSFARLAAGLSALAAGPTAMVAVGGQGEVLTSNVGDHWRRVLWGGSAALADVTWGTAGFVAVGEGVVVVSRDGSAWSGRPSPENASLARVVAVGSRYLGVEWGDRLFASEDGLAWLRVDLSGLGLAISFFPDLAVGGGTAVASVWKRDQGGAILASRDGLVWVKAADTASGLPELVWGGGRFLATDFDRVLASADGMTWQEVHHGMELVGLEWVGDRFVAWDRDGAFFESTDGSNWRRARGPVGTATASRDGSLWRVDGDGAIRRSACGPAALSAWLPSLAHLHGAGGTVWRSDVELHNPVDEPLTVGLVATPRGAAVPAAALGVRLEAGQALRLEDVLAGWLGVEEAATVEVASWGGRVLAVGRTYNEMPSGTYGQSIPAHTAAAMVQPGEEGRLIQLSHAADRRSGFRTNIGLVAPHAAASADVELVRDDGTLLGTRRVAVPAGTAVQLHDVFRAVTAADVPAAFAVVKPGAASGPVFAYASVVDNVTGDPLLVTPARAVGSGDAGWLPGSGHVTGLGGSMWRTDLELHNPGDATADCEIDLFPRDAASGPAGSVVVRVAGGTSLRLADVVWTQFRHEGGATLRVRPTTGTVMVAARTYTVAGEGSFGQFIPALSLDDAVTPTTAGRLIMLRQDARSRSGFRTNLGLVNVGGLEVAVELDVMDATGHPLGRLVRVLAPYQSVQLTEALRLVAPAGVDDAVIVVRTTTPGAAVLAHACLIDNRTNDPVFLPAQAEPRPAVTP